jgi:hypothetical protein
MSESDKEILDSCIGKRTSPIKRYDAKKKASEFVMEINESKMANP